MPSLFTFSIFFKWQQIVDWNVLLSSANSRVLMRGLHSTNFPKVSSLRSDERPGLVLSPNDVPLEQNFENIVSDLPVSNDTLAINTRNVLTVSIAFLLFLKLPHYLSNMHFQFLHFSGVRSQIKLYCTLFYYWIKKDRCRLSLIR